MIEVYFNASLHFANLTMSEWMRSQPHTSSGLPFIAGHGYGRVREEHAVPDLTFYSDIALERPRAINELDDTTYLDDTT